MVTENVVITAADTGYFNRLEGLIQSLKANSPETEVWVYDLGLSSNDKKKLLTQYNIPIRNIPLINPKILTPLPYNTTPNTRNIVGLYSWKPVAIMDALYYYKNVLWLDAGTSVIKDLKPIFEHIENEGCFLIGVSDIGWMCTDTVKKHYNLTDEFLALQGVNAGIQGVSQRHMADYAMDAYLAAHDIGLFVDNGTAAGGKTSGRHDQTLFSVFARKYNMPFFTNGNDIKLNTHEGVVSVSIPYQRHEVKPDMIIYHGRGDINFWKTLKR